MDTSPVKSFAKASRVVVPNQSQALVFDNEKQRNTRFLNKGLSKPGAVSFDVLRRAVQSTHIARICVNVLKEKVTKTDWVIKPVDQGKEKDMSPEMQRQIDEITELFKHPNNHDETFRTMCDKLLEDLLVLDVACLEKTRYPDGTLAELFYVDGSTIRPVFDEYGNQDLEIPITIKGETETHTEPVSYVQILNNSQYGGPESGDVIAAWAKKDFIRFMMHPQGAFEGIGYGLSPIESVVSVVSNILNADNYNAVYFEEGSFPPLIIQLLGQVNQRDVQLFKEYFRAEMSGNFHRPAIMAGGTDAKVLNLKDITNNDMQFMEYMKFMAQLLAAAYGLSGQDIGLTEDVGSKNVSETQKDLSQAKGYSSILHLLKEVFNQEILWKDYGYTDIEFDWVQDDTIEPKDAMDIYSKALAGGLMTVNESRMKLGLQPYTQKWANEPMVLTTTGYVPMLAQSPDQDEAEDAEMSVEETEPDDDVPNNKEKEDKEATAEDKVVGNEEVYREQDLSVKSFGDRVKTALKSILPTLTTTTTAPPDQTPVIFGDLIKDEVLKDSVRRAFAMNDAVVLSGYRIIGYSYNLEATKNIVLDYIKNNPKCYGGIVTSPSAYGAQYTAYISETV